MDSPTIDGSSHCLLHNLRAVTLYRRYKRSCDQLDHYNHDEVLSSKSIKTLLRFYSVVQKAYIGRLKHRAYAFIEEHHDAGHNYQLRSLNLLLTKAEESLEAAFEQVISEDNTKSSEESSEEFFNESSFVREKVSRFRSQRASLEAETEEILQKYTQVNIDLYVHLKDEKILVEDKIFKLVDKLTPEVKEFKNLDPLQFRDLGFLHQQYHPSDE